MNLLVRWWILSCSLVVASGWALSALHALNRLGYGLALGLTVLVCGWWGMRAGAGIEPMQREAGKLFRRFRRRPAPGIFLILLVMAFLAGAIYDQDNSDTNDYRIPRVWHWLAAGQWHWIHTYDTRLNNIGTGFEWLTAPLMLFTRTDRWIYLINWVSYLFLPGLTFSVFTRLGVRPRVAWWWMWLAPAGWGFAMQASSVVNDSFAAVYVMAALDFALRARRSGRIDEVWLAVLSCALMTGPKQTNLPLILPCGLALLPVAGLLLRRPLASLAVLVVAGLASIVPLTLLNLHYTGNWMGISQDMVSLKLGWRGCSLDSPVWGLVGNIFILTFLNLQPPIVPGVDKWNALMVHFLHTGWGKHFQQFDQFGYLESGATEASAGLGPLLFLFILLTAFLVLRRWQRNWVVRGDGWLWLLRLAPWVALAAFMAKLGAYQLARYAAPFYLLLLPVFLVLPGNLALVRSRWWRRLGLLTMIGTIGVLTISRIRPMFPADTVLAALHQRCPQSKFIASTQVSFDIRNEMKTRKHWFAAHLPPDEKLIGYAVVHGGLEPGLWLPFGSRQVYRVVPGETSAELQAKGIHYVVADDNGLGYFNLTIDGWMKQMPSTIYDRQEYQANHNATNHVYVLHLDPPVPSPANRNR